MSGVVPGFVPRRLVDPDIGLFRADERVFTAMLDGWRAQMLARGLTTDTIKQRCQLLERFQRFTGEFPWQWRPADIDDFLASALWPSERGARMSLGSFGDAFAAARDAVGLPHELGLHCPRHFYVTHLVEAGYDAAFVQTQVGHSYASTTGLYTSASSDFKQKTVQQMIARRIANLEDPGA
ncbi:tyrosine-type recombinase/integrase [Paenarthrobacter sp. YJN-5]|nr:tyrosine-type recombinase/integrase [Paenarthrobacter sp. YJN-5]